ncbi:MAG: branched-chain amino acid ABC transporter permease [Chloroflexota bacterium]
MKVEVDPRRRPTIIGLLVILAILAAAGPFLASNRYAIQVATLILLFAYLASGWNILSGYGGQFSFGHAAFFGLGAYTSTILFVKFGVSPWVGMLAAGLVSALLGLFIGLACFRSGLRGAYFALATLAFAEILRVIFVNWDWVGRSQGLLIQLVGDEPLLFQFTARLPYYYIALALLALVSGVALLLERLKLGYELRAIKSNEVAAAVLGVDVFRAKMWAMGLSAFFTGIGGTFYAQYFYYIEPFQVFGVGMSVDILLPAIIGGAGTVIGPIIGAAILVLLGEGTRTFFRGFAGADLMVFGVILVLVILFMPYGVMGLLGSAPKAKKESA